jgi:hypothetical protein
MELAAAVIVRDWSDWTLPIDASVAGRGISGRENRQCISWK